MNVDDLKNIWKDDMAQLNKRVDVSEERIAKLEFNKAKTSFDKLLQMSIAGKNMALVYAVLAIALMYPLRADISYLVVLAISAGLMIFSYFQHSVLKSLDYAKLSVLALQKEIASFRVHTARTAIYDMSIVAIWIVGMMISFMKWRSDVDVFKDMSALGSKGLLVVVLVVLMVVFSKVIYKSYDVKLKEYEANLNAVKDFETNA